jgi:DNA-binding GntR family transcriptional regulator
VKFLPNRGCFMCAFDQREAKEVFSMRTTLENLAAA